MKPLAIPVSMTRKTDMVCHISGVMRHDEFCGWWTHRDVRTMALKYVDPTTMAAASNATNVRANNELVLNFNRYDKLKRK